MRELKFRAWHKKRKKFCENVTLSFLAREDEFHLKGNVKEYDFEQFIGLLDKNGTEIYEGDIYTHGSDSIRYKVIYSGDMFTGNQIGNKSLAGLLPWLDRIEVIGNIHENPELLQK